MFLPYRKIIITAFILWAAVSAYYTNKLTFSFDFEQFFPQDDPDLEYFQSFIKEFETDDNFLLIAVRNEPDVFDSSFLNRFHQYCLSLRNVPYVHHVQSLTMMRYPVNTPFGINTVPVIHRNQPEWYAQDKAMLLSDPRFVHNLINEKVDALVVILKHKDAIKLSESKELIMELERIQDQYGFEKTFMLGRADLQTQLVRFQKIEITRTAILSFILVSFILWLLYRKPIGLAISLISISMGLVIFTGLMAMLGREFNALSALYPILLLIVGTSDVIHIQSKYIDELRKGYDRIPAMITSIKEIGLATLLTSTTTAIGFATLITSRLQPIREFGVNAAIGVLIAYITVILFTTCIMTFFRGDQISKFVDKKNIWDRIIQHFYIFSIKKKRMISAASLLLLFIFAMGISRISTNYNITNSLPRGERVTRDFIYFENEFAGFRPFEFAVEAKNNYSGDDYAVVKEVNKLEEHLMAIPEIKTTVSLATLYKSVERMNGGNSPDAYRFPENISDFEKAKKIIDKSRLSDVNVLLNKDKSKTRLSSRILDIGADSITVLGERIDQWASTNLDTSVVHVTRTGTGLILTKNAEYVRNSLFSGLVLAILAVSVVMGLLFMSWKILLIAILPNLFPLLLAAAIIGYSGIELEAGISVVFAIIFGIAVDDTIHFLSKFKLALRNGKNIEQSLKVTFEETGKAIMFTTIILFFGFLLMLFSNNPPSFTIGILISTTLIGAFLFDLTLLPVLLRKYINDNHNPVQPQARKMTPVDQPL